MPCSNCQPKRYLPSSSSNPSQSSPLSVQFAPARWAVLWPRLSWVSLRPMGQVWMLRGGICNCLSTVNTSHDNQQSSSWVLSLTDLPCDRRSSWLYGSMGALCSTYMVVLLPHSKKVLGFASELWQGCSLWSVHVLPVLSWCSSECSGFPHYQNMYLRLILLSVTLNKALAKIWSRSLGAVCWLHTAPRVLVRSHYYCMIVSNKIMILLLPM